jgi:AraC-like DNA-binding protein
LQADDCVLLPNGRRFKLARDLAFQSIHISELSESDWRDGIAKVGGGGETMVLGGHFAFAGAHTDMLLGSMPPILRLRDEVDRQGLRWVLDRMRRELTTKSPGRVMVARNLAQLLLVEALRLYLAQASGRVPGWLFALGDDRLAPAVIAMHQAPGEHWTLPTLAEKAGMSRSKFALRFKTITGVSPIDYLARWRMLLASDRLAAGREPVAAIALSMGYDSDAAFSTAFKRIMGNSPREYATLHRSTVE